MRFGFFKRRKQKETKKLSVEEIEQRIIEEVESNKKLMDDIITRVKIKTAAAADARMSGYDAVVMSSAGSGNQGIVVSIPVVEVGKAYQWDQEKIIKSVTLSHLMTAYTSYYVGYLSALCGCATKAGIGATCGITYGLGGFVGALYAGYIYELYPRQLFLSAAIIALMASGSIYLWSNANRVKS